MNKTTVAVLCIVSSGLFLALVVMGFRNSRGVPVTVEERTRPVLPVPRLDRQIDLQAGLGDDAWAGIDPVGVELAFQLMVEPWGKGLSGPLQAKAFHNGKDIYFHLSWKDLTEDWAVKPDTFTDGCAIMFPFDTDGQPVSLMMGFLGKADILHWKASQDYAFWFKRNSSAPSYADWHYPFEEEELFPVQMPKVISAVSELVAVRVGTVTIKESPRASGRGIWKSGAWQVVLKRPLGAGDPEVDTALGTPETRPVAFAVWNGKIQDRGGRKSISEWVELRIE